MLQNYKFGKRTQNSVRFFVFSLQPTGSATDDKMVWTLEESKAVRS